MTWAEYGCESDKARVRDRLRWVLVACGEFGVEALCARSAVRSVAFCQLVRFVNDDTGSSRGVFGDEDMIYVTLSAAVAVRSDAASSTTGRNEDLGVLFGKQSVTRYM